MGKAVSVRQDPFNPLAIDSLGLSIYSRMMAGLAVRLDQVPSFGGAGVYAIYYHGPFTAYAPLTIANRDNACVPIYVGKAVTPGRRKGTEIKTATQPRPLAKRLGEHRDSVAAAHNLDVVDFKVRWLVMEDLWIPLGESVLIQGHVPIWNSVVDGFGNHNPGSGRAKSTRSRWDTLHPGRDWATGLGLRTETPEQIIQEATEYLRSRLA